MRAEDSNELLRIQGQVRLLQKKISDLNQLNQTEKAQARSVNTGY